MDEVVAIEGELNAIVKEVGMKCITVSTKTWNDLQPPKTT